MDFKKSIQDKILSIVKNGTREHNEKELNLFIKAMFVSYNEKFPTATIDALPDSIVDFKIKQFLDHYTTDGVFYEKGFSEDFGGLVFALFISHDQLEQQKIAKMN